MRIGAHVISGLFAACSSLCFTALISSGDPNQGTTYTLIAVTALVLGGANLAGGRASIFGSLLGAVNIYLITYVLATFSFGAVQSFVTDLSYGDDPGLVADDNDRAAISPAGSALCLSAAFLRGAGNRHARGHPARDFRLCEPTGRRRHRRGAVHLRGCCLGSRGARAASFVKPMVFLILLIVSVPGLLRLFVRRDRPATLAPVVYVLAAGLCCSQSTWSATRIVPRIPSARQHRESIMSSDITRGASRNRRSSNGSASASPPSSLGLAAGFGIGQGIPAQEIILFGAATFALVAWLGVSIRCARPPSWRARRRRRGVAALDRRRVPHLRREEPRLLIFSLCC